MIKAFVKSLVLHGKSKILKNLHNKLSARQINQNSHSTTGFFFAKILKLQPNYFCINLGVHFLFFLLNVII